MRPEDRSILFLATIAAALVIGKETAALLANRKPPAGFEAAYETGQYLLGVAVQLLSSVFAAGSGTFISDAVGSDASSKPVYTLLLCTTIVGLLFLGRRALEKR